MSPKRDAKIHSIQANSNSIGSNEDGEFVDGLKIPPHKIFLSCTMDSSCRLPQWSYQKLR